MFKLWFAPSNTVKATLRIAASLLVLLSVSIQVEAKSSYEQKSSANNPILLEKGDNQTLARRPLRGLRRRVEEGLRRQGKPPVVVGTPERLRRVLDSLKPRRIKVGSTELSLDRNSWRHILTRHHREYWDGTTRDKQTFFRRNMTINQIEDAILDVIKQNRQSLRTVGAEGKREPIVGVVDGIRYRLGVRRGRIRTFYPLSE